MLQLSSSPILRIFNCWVISVTNVTVTSHDRDCHLVLELFRNTKANQESNSQENRAAIQRP
jgi:hypothetical protein